MSETLTVLRSLDGAPLRKGISYDPDSNLVTVTKKYRGSDNFSAELKGIDGVASAYAVLSEIAKDKYKAVVIGKPAEGVNLAHMKRDSRTIQEQPRQLIPFDVDSFPLDPELFDKFKDVHDLAGMVRAFFPEEYQTAACVFNVTQSHGSEPDNLRLRLWFWLDTPVTRAGLHALWSESGSIVAVDRSVWEPSQLIFTALPDVPGGDPVKERWGVLGGTESVCVPVHRLAGNRVAAPVDERLFCYFESPNNPVAVFQATEELRGRLMRAVAAGEVQPGVAGTRTPWFLQNVKRLRDYYVIGDEAVAVVKQICKDAGITDSATLKGLEGSVPRWLESGQNPLGFSTKPGRKGHFEAVDDPDEISPEQVAANLAGRKAKQKKGGLKHWTSADFAESAYTVPRVDLIKNYFQARKMVMLYGTSNSGKSYVALDMAGAIGGGQEFNNCATKQAGVVYFAAEGGDGLRARYAAMCISRGLQPATTPIDFLTGSLNLSGGGEELAGFKQEILRIENVSGKVSLVIIDTYSQIHSSDENSTQEANALAKALSTIVDDLDLTVMVIHHSGKDLSRGARGSNILRGCVDSELELEGGILKVTKQRDMTFAPPASYQIKSFILARSDAAGNPIDAGVIEWLGPVATKSATQVRKGSLSDFTLHAYAALAGEGGGPVNADALMDATRDLYCAKYTETPSRSGLWRAQTTLISSGLLVKNGTKKEATLARPGVSGRVGSFTPVQDDGDD